MAETLTYQNDTDTVTTEDNLTAEEQESLKVGEELVEQQEQLLAGKYKDAEELEKAYVELQKKLGEKGTEDSEEAGNTESSDTETEDKEEKETDENSEEFYLEDGKVNYEHVNKEYGEQLGELFKNSDVDPWAISKHFHDNQGTITEDMYSQLENAGLARQTIDAYLDGRAVESGYRTETVKDLTAQDITEVKSAAGGDKEYDQLVQWAADNLDKSDISAFDELISSGNIGAIKLAVSGLKSQYENVNGYEGTMVSGKAPKSGEVFRSQAELVRAMSDPRYDNDPAYRQDIIDKLDRSNNLDF